MDTLFENGAVLTLEDGARTAEALLVRDGLYDEMSETAPNLREVLNQLAGTLTNETMTDLTYTVDVEGRTVEEVAREFLTESGLIG